MADVTFFHLKRGAKKGQQYRLAAYWLYLTARQRDIPPAGLWRGWMELC